MNPNRPSSFSGDLQAPAPSTSYGGESASSDVASFFAKVYGWMFLGLLVSAGVAAYFGTQQDMIEKLQENPLLFLIPFLGTLGLVLAISFLQDKVTSSVLAFMFILFCGVMGFLLSGIVAAYTPGSIAVTFGITASMFGSMAVIGFVTKKDLSSWGGILLMALIGLIVGSIVNIIWFNEAIYWALTGFGIIIFCGLTVYDMNRLKEIARSGGSDGNAIAGALGLYLNFVNLFLYLLRIFGSSR